MTNKSRNVKLMNLWVGYDYPIRVNCNIGINSKDDYKNELTKIHYINENLNSTPDMYMDLSTINLKRPLYKEIIDVYKKPVGIVPVYNLFKNNEINKNEILENLENHIDNGVSFFTIHFTANHKNLQTSLRTRKIPITSRGGGITLKIQESNSSKENLFLDMIDEIIPIFKRKNITLNLGTTFRPASTCDGLDEVHISETLEQLEICSYLTQRGVKVILENIGHINLKDIEIHSKLLKKFNVPIMPLGPFPTDIGFKHDSMVASVGASFLGYNNALHIINSITSKEHSGSSFSKEDLRFGVEQAKLSAYMVNLALNKIDDSKEKEIYLKRAENRNCLVTQECSRCASYCPLKIEEW